MPTLYNSTSKKGYLNVMFMNNKFTPKHAVYRMRVVIEIIGVIHNFLLNL